MGIISKQIRKSANQKVAAADVIPSSLAPAAAVADIQAVCIALNANVDAHRATMGSLRAALTAKGDQTSTDQFHYHVSVNPGGTSGRIGFAKTPEAIDRATNQRRSMLDDWWLASFDCEASGDGSEITLTLLRWVIDRNGKLQSKDRYEHLKSELLGR